MHPSTGLVPLRPHQERPDRFGHRRRPVGLGGQVQPADFLLPPCPLGRGLEHGIRAGVLSGLEFPRVRGGGEKEVFGPLREAGPDGIAGLAGNAPRLAGTDQVVRVVLAGEELRDLALRVDLPDAEVAVPVPSALAARAVKSVRRRRGAATKVSRLAAISSARRPRRRAQSVIALWADRKRRGFCDFPERVRQSRYPCHTCAIFPVCGGMCPKKWDDGTEPCPAVRFNVRERLLPAYAMGRISALHPTPERVR